jgi:High potential iron-sulfur protein
MKSSRRTFLITSLGTACALAISRQAFADAPMLAESDPTAQALGYKADATQVDKAKYSKYAAGQDCANCSAYQGKPGSMAGPCPLFGEKQVAAKGWCNAYIKKA